MLIINSSFSVLAAFPTVLPSWIGIFYACIFASLHLLGKGMVLIRPSWILHLLSHKKNKVTVHRFMVLFNIRTIG